MYRVLACALLAGGIVAAGTDWDQAGSAWWKHVQYLASDELEGRNVGSPGYEKAAAYVAEQFERAGLKAAGTNGYFQPVEFTEASLDKARTRLALVRKDGKREINIPEEAQLNYSPESAPSLEAPLVFAGYGLVIPEAHFDDLANVNAKGAVVVFLTGGPNSISGNLRSHYSSTQERWKALRAAGAVGYISIPNPKSMEIPWQRQILAWGRPRVTLSDTSIAGTPGLKFGASWDPAQADDLLTGSGHNFAEVLAAANANSTLPHFTIGQQLQARVPVSTRPVSSKNVVAVRPGTDQRLRNEYVVISAHLDHIGTGPPIHGDGIYNGAMDDASGIASLIEIANHLRTGNVQTKRSILFVAVTAEEKGELGSEFYAHSPTISGRIVADLNMDMFLPLFPLKWLEVQGLDESTLGDNIRALAQAAGVQVQADKEPNRNRFIRSDQYSFIKTGVPALAFKFGYIPGGPEEKIFKDWYTNRYHGVADDTNQPVDLAAAAQFNSILEQLAIRVADAPQAPAWKQNSFFRRFSGEGK